MGSAGSEEALRAFFNPSFVKAAKDGNPAMVS